MQLFSFGSDTLTVGLSRETGCAADSAGIIFGFREGFCYNGCRSGLRLVSNLVSGIYNNQVCVHAH